MEENNENVKAEVKRNNNTGIIVILVIIILVLGGCCGYLLLKKPSNEETTKIENNQEQSKAEVECNISLDRINVIDDSTGFTILVYGTKERLEYDENKYSGIVLSGYCLGLNDEKFPLHGQYMTMNSNGDNEIYFNCNYTDKVEYSDGTVKSGKEVDWENVKIKFCKIDKMEIYTKDTPSSIIKEFNYDKYFNQIVNTFEGSSDKIYLFDNLTFTWRHNQGDIENTRWGSYHIDNDVLYLTVYGYEGNGSAFPEISTLMDQNETYKFSIKDNNLYDLKTNKLLYSNNNSLKNNEVESWFTEIYKRFQAVQSK